MRTVATIAIDTYDWRGNLVGSLLGARASSELIDPHDALEHFVTNLPAGWRQMTYEEVHDHLSRVHGTQAPGWEQLSIF